MTYIWLIRHGMTGPGEEGRYQGSLDECLSGKGRAALRRADFDPARVYVSPAKRAVETASILFPGAEQICAPDLREMDFGVFEGRHWREMEHDAQYRAWVDGGCLGTCPGGESRASFSARVCSAFLAILSEEIRRSAENRHPEENREKYSAETSSAQTDPSDSSSDWKCPGDSSSAQTDPGDSFSDRKCPADSSSGQKYPADSSSVEKTLKEDCLRVDAPDTNIFIVAHGGTQMAVLERWGRPAREYYSWQRPCGCGWLLEAGTAGTAEPAEADSPAAGSNDSLVLRALREVSFV